MSIIDNHVLAIVNNKDGINAFCENYLWHDDEFNEYIEGIKLYFNFGDFSECHYNYNSYKYEIMNELYGDHIKEQFFNNTIKLLVEDITDTDKHIILQFLIIESRLGFTNLDVDEILYDYVDNKWKGLICSYIYLKVHNMILNEEHNLHDGIIKKIEECICDKLREKIITNIAINKIKRNKIFNLGLGLKLSIRNCGIMVGA
jgi:hypothetical protein